MNKEDAMSPSPVSLTCVKYQTDQTSGEQISYLTNQTLIRLIFWIILLVLQEMLTKHCKQQTCWYVLLLSLILGSSGC